LCAASLVAGSCVQGRLHPWRGICPQCCHQNGDSAGFPGGFRESSPWIGNYRGQHGGLYGVCHIKKKVAAIRGDAAATLAAAVMSVLLGDSSPNCRNGHSARQYDRVKRKMSAASGSDIVERKRSRLMGKRRRDLFLFNQDDPKEVGIHYPRNSCICCSGSLNFGGGSGSTEVGSHIRLRLVLSGSSRLGVAWQLGSDGGNELCCVGSDGLLHLRSSHKQYDNNGQQYKQKEQYEINLIYCL
jgi:hypothetical protein